MAGGLLQIATYGTQDIFLTGNPQITFFKIVYHRYTNFSIQTFEEPFSGIINFNEIVKSTLSKIGDLAYRMYLKIQLPNVHLSRPLDQTLVTNATQQLNDAKTNYDNLNNYANFIFDAYNIVFRELQPINADPDQINNTVNFFFTAQIDTIAFQNAASLVPTNIVNNSDIQTQINNIVSNTSLNTTQKLNQILTCINQISTYLNNINQQYYNIYLNQLNIYNDATTPFYNFSWIKRIGHFIYNYIDIDIGGTRIDRHYNDWINIWYELTNNEFMIPNYDKMIGDVPILTNYDRNEKPTYTLYVPLYFWFNRNNGLALPLVAMRYSDVNITVNLRKIEECIITDYDNSDNDIMDKIVLDNMTLLVDYIFLDQDERQRFAQSIHEYLIEQTQREEFINLSNKGITCQLNFVRTCKEILWISKKNYNIDIYNLTINPNWYYYGLEPIPYDNGIVVAGNLNSVTLQNSSSNIDDFYKNYYIKIIKGKGINQISQIIKYFGSNKVAITSGWKIAPDYTSEYALFNVYPIQGTIDDATLLLNGEPRINTQPNNFYNFVTTFESHTNSPNYGIYDYSFAIKPELIQPSGTCNLGRINDIKLQINMSDDFINSLNGSQYNVKVFATNYNILRVMGGFAGTAFSM